MRSFLTIMLLMLTVVYASAENCAMEATLTDCTAAAFAKMELPDFSDLDSHFVSEEFYRFYYKDKEGCLEKLKQKVNQKSGGKVLLREEDYEKFNLRVKGPAIYLVLIKDKEQKRVIIGPYSNPILLDRPD
jgi:hypothetical protein